LPVKQGSEIEILTAQNVYAHSLLSNMMKMVKPFLQLHFVKAYDTKCFRVDAAAESVYFYPMKN
jgi:hypothetical protein